MPWAACASNTAVGHGCDAGAAAHRLVGTLDVENDARWAVREDSLVVNLSIHCQPVSDGTALSTHAVRAIDDVPAITAQYV